MTSQALAQWVFDHAMESAPPGLLARLQSRCAHFLFRKIQQSGDPLIKRTLWGTPLRMPFSHQLPIVLQRFPSYAANLGRLVRLAAEKYPSLRVIDVGANIGDSVAVIRQHSEAPVLCIEGDPEYVDILKANQAALRHVEIMPCFLGEETGSAAMALSHQHGSASLRPSHQGGVSLRRLSEALKTAPDFQSAKLLKIDTDGYDGKVLRGAQAYLRSAKPVIFFEDDPDMLAKQGDNGLDIFHYLAGLGYDGLLIYDNFGDFLLSTEIENHRLLSEMDLYFTGRKSAQYCDVAVFHSDDRDLFERMRRQEQDSAKREKTAHV